ncbi:MAG: hypothetical protein JWN00_804 [Actinomycetia bacterium]|nr:hypothetical protein [Actinomycetes bacterium]
MTRDIRISDEVLEVVGTQRAQALRTEPLRFPDDPGNYECVECKRPGDADTEPTSVVVYRYTKLINIVFAHASCAPSTVTHCGDLDMRGIMGTHVTALQLTGEGEEEDKAALVVEPIFPVVSLERETNLHVQAWLRAGLHLVTSLEEPPPHAAGWRAVFLPGDDAEQTKVTILALTGSPNGPETIADNAAIRVPADWAEIVRADGRVTLYGGLTSIRRLGDRSPINVARAMATAYQAGMLVGGSIEAVWIDLSAE